MLVFVFKPTDLFLHPQNNNNKPTKSNVHLPAKHTPLKKKKKEADGSSGFLNGGRKESLIYTDRQTVLGTLMCNPNAAADPLSIHLINYRKV